MTHGVPSDMVYTICDRRNAGIWMGLFCTRVAYPAYSSIHKFWQDSLSMRLWEYSEFMAALTPENCTTAEELRCKKWLAAPNGRNQKNDCGQWMSWRRRGETVKIGWSRKCGSEYRLVQIMDWIKSGQKLTWITWFKKGVDHTMNWIKNSSVSKNVLEQNMASITKWFL